VLADLAGDDGGEHGKREQRERDVEGVVRQAGVELVQDEVAGFAEGGHQRQTDRHPQQEALGAHRWP
jgi:hypothetical protein